MFSGALGIFHTVVSCLALIAGTVVLLNKKGTRFHKRVGYFYAINMLLVNITAFGLYNLFGGFGMFHALAIVSFLTLLLGMYPVLFRYRVKYWYVMHLKLMGWSVVGLYAALAAEISTRLLPPQYFFITLAVSSLTIIGIGAYFIYKRQRIELRKIKSLEKRS